MPRRKSDQPKTDYHVLLPATLAEQIATRATTRKETATQVITKLIATGIAAEEAARMEHSAMPIMRAALGEDQALALDELRRQIYVDVKTITQQHTDRLAAMQMRAARSSSLAWRLIYRHAQKQYGAAIVQAWYDEERAKAGKAMATRTDTGKEIER